MPIGSKGWTDRRHGKQAGYGESGDDLQDLPLKVAIVAGLPCANAPQLQRA
jgi:hypothetical protein